MEQHASNSAQKRKRHAPWATGALTDADFPGAAVQGRHALPLSARSASPPSLKESPTMFHPLAGALAGAASLCIAGAAFGACTGPGAPSNTETKCLTAVQIPGAAL